MIFKATLDKTSKLFTIGMPVLLIGFAIGPKLWSTPVNGSAAIIGSIILVFTYIITYALSPTSYEIKEDSMIIHRPLKDVIIHRSEIVEVHQMEEGKLARSMRLFGSGGLFGYFGLFWNKEFGTMTWYATRRDQAMMIITSSPKKLVITPDETDAFMQAYAALTTKKI
jgi:hypothetical protein